jgi:DNA mismatch repair ATPase MutS
MLTTHFNELAELKNSAKNVVFNHVTALVREKGITFQYVVEPGVCGQSFGINVAQMAGLPTHVIQVRFGPRRGARRLT